LIIGEDSGKLKRDVGLKPSEINVRSEAAQGRIRVIGVVSGDVKAGLVHRQSVNEATVGSHLDRNNGTCSSENPPSDLYITRPIPPSTSRTVEIETEELAAGAGNVAGL
jgi:hypothetical protein